MLGLTCAVAATTAWMAFILSSLLIVGTVAWSDGCYILALAAGRGWETAGLDGQSAAVLDGCFRGRSVADEFNITEALGFFESYAVLADEVKQESLFIFFALRVRHSTVQVVVVVVLGVPVPCSLFVCLVVFYLSLFLCVCCFFCRRCFQISESVSCHTNRRVGDPRLQRNTNSKSSTKCCV